MKLHVLSLPWTETTTEFATCAYTQKVVKFGRMMTDAGYDVIVYSGEENNTVCAEHVPVIAREERIRWFGEHDQNSVWGHITWDQNHESWRTMNRRAAHEIQMRAEPHDLVLLSAGQSQAPLLRELPELITCEPFVGYKGIIGGRVFCAFESHVWRHCVYGMRSIHDPSWDDGRWYDDVIPNYFDPDDFRYNPIPDDYLLFVGRVTVRKNPHVAAQIAKALGMRLVVAGPGVQRVERNRIVADHCVLEGNHVEYVGVAGVEERKDLMANASVLIAPTAFLEPFGGVAVEAMISGTPAVTSNWGAFTETIDEGTSGYRFRTFAEGVRATEDALMLDRETVAEYAQGRYTLKAVAPQFDRWFRQLEGLWDGGWTNVNGPGRVRGERKEQELCM
jgi:glycosyltransferase involved in cell wall biosynthesis